MKRAIVFAHYDKDNIVDPYVYYYLSSLQKLSDALVFVSTVALSDDEQKKLNNYCTHVIVRENKGYDFMSYKVGLQQLNYENYDEIIICNDSVYAPLFPLEEMFSTMESRKDIAFWGVSDNHAFAHHIQSYFVAFKKEVFMSQAFQSFWDNFTILDDKKQIIQQYEVGLSKQLHDAGFRFDVLYQYRPSFIQEFILRIRRLSFERLVNKLQRVLKQEDQFSTFGTINNTHFYWRDMLKQKVPFLKIELVRDNPYSVDIADLYDMLKEQTNYDVMLIQNHIKRVKQK